MNEYEPWIAEGQTELEYFKARYLEMSAACAEKDAEIARLRQEVMLLEGKSNRRLSALIASGEAWQAVCAEKDKDIAALICDIKEADRHSSQLQNALDHEKGACDEKDRRIAALEAQHDAANLEEWMAALAEKDARIAELEAECQRLKERNKEKAELLRGAALR